MAQTSAIIDKLLTNVSRGLFQADADFISESVLPSLSVAQDTGKIGSYGKSHLRVVNSLMGGRGMAPRIHTDATSSDSYVIEDHGLEDIITRSDYRNVEKPFDAESDSVKFLQSMLWLGKEKALADALFSTTNMTKNTTLTGTDQLSDYVNSDPLEVFKDARASVYTYGGRVANSCIMSWKVAETLRYHPQILENLGFNRVRAGQMSVDELARALSVDNLYIGKAVYNTTAQGQTDTLGAVWGNHILFYYAPKNPTLRDQSLGFLINPIGGNRKVYKYAVNNPPEANAILVTDSYDTVITDINCGYLIYNAIA